MIDTLLPSPGTQPFLPSLLSHVHSAAPGFPLEPVIVQVLLLCIISGDKNLILRTRDEDVTLVSKLTASALNTIFGYSTHTLKCHSNSANKTPSEFLRSLFFAVSTIAPSTDNNLSGSSHKHRHGRASNLRNSVGKLPIAPSVSVSTARSRRTSVSRSTSHPSESKPSITTPGRPQLDSENANPHTSINVGVYPQRPSFHPAGAQTDTSVPTLGTHSRNVSRGSTEPLKLPSTVVVSGLELASLPSQKAVLRTLAERKIVVSDGGIFGHDQDGLTLELPDGFFMVYVCRSDPRERPPIYKSLLDRFAMSSSVDVGAQTRSAIRQFRPPSSPSVTLSSPHTPLTSAAFPTLHSLTSFPGPPTPPQSLASPVIPSALLQRLKHLCATQARIRPPLDIYLADLFSATRHYGPLDGMMLTVRARQDAEALVRASRVLGADCTGAELIKEHAERSHETVSTSTYPQSLPSIASASSDGLIDGIDVPETHEALGCPSLQHSLASQLEQPIELDVSEADIARMFPRVVSHRIRVRDSPFDEILSSAVCGATSTHGNESQEGEAIQWERETVKDILVHILAEWFQGDKWRADINDACRSLGSGMARIPENSSVSVPLFGLTPTPVQNQPPTMTNGPPASQAGPSQPSTTTSSTSETVPQQPPYNPVQPNAQPGPSQPPQQPVQYTQAHLAQQAQSQAQTQGQQNAAQAYYMGYPPGAWQNAWQLSGYPYATSGNSPYQQTHYTQIPYAQYQQYQPQPAARQRKLPPKPRTPTPEPAYRHWDQVIRAFLEKVGLTQALRGFEDDMVVLNADWERKSVPGAIGDLVRDLMTLGKFREGEEPKERPLEERKLDYIHLSTGAEPQSQSTVTKAISQFLAQNRAKNDASNRAEFLESLAQKRRRLNVDPESTGHIPSCARTDAKPLDRDSQMKYDIAKNEDGPLRRTVKGPDGKEAQTKEKLGALTNDTPSELQPAIDERLKNIESHIAVRYVPAPPRTLLARLQFLEDHITQLENEYPPWAALHFNQPNRGWPPPPRQTPIIVPSHLTTKDAPVERATGPLGSTDEAAGALPKGKNKNKSSLHRAVMEKLEVQKAMSDLAGTQRIG